MSFSNISFVVILVDGSVCIPGHVSRTCSCVSMLSGHFRHFVSLYLPLKLFFTSNILVIALKVFSIFFLKKFFSWLEFISPVFVSCVVLFIFSFILLVVSFYPFLY